MNKANTKSLFKSLTMYAGAGVAVLGFAGIEATPEGVNAIIHNAQSIVEGVLGLAAMFGRWRATHAISL
jgi:hypothetical protein